MPLFPRDPLSILAEKLVSAQHHDDALGATTYSILIDLDGTAPDYKHVGSSSIKILSVNAGLVKSSIGAQWKAIIGVILAIDGTEATIAWLDAGAIFALDTGKDEQHKSLSLSAAFDLEIDSGDLVKASSGYIEVGNTNVNTATPLNNTKGNPTTPAVGDMLLLVTLVSGGGQAEVNYGIRYFVD